MPKLASASVRRHGARLRQLRQETQVEFTLPGETRIGGAVSMDETLGSRGADSQSGRQEEISRTNADPTGRTKGHAWLVEGAGFEPA